MVENYFKILDLPPTATLQEVKKEYRLKAKQFHPDLNQSPIAKEKFIEVNEAYEYLLNYYKVMALRESQALLWNYEKKKQARARAAYYAKKRYEDFERSKVYRSAKVMYNFFDAIFLFVGVTVILIPFLFMDLEDLELEGKIGSIFAAVIAVGFGLMLTGATLYSLISRWFK